MRILWSQVVLVVVSVFSLSAGAADWNYICSELGKAGDCACTRSCTEEYRASCLPLPHLTGTDWDKTCRRAGVNEMACGWQSNHCRWQTQRLCVPRRG